MEASNWLFSYAFLLYLRQWRTKVMLTPSWEIFLISPPDFSNFGEASFLTSGWEGIPVPISLISLEDALFLSVHHHLSVPRQLLQFLFFSLPSFDFSSFTFLHFSQHDQCKERHENMLTKSPATYPTGLYQWLYQVELNVVWPRAHWCRVRIEQGGIVRWVGVRVCHWTLKLSCIPLVSTYWSPIGLCLTHGIGVKIAVCGGEGKGVDRPTILSSE